MTVRSNQATSEGFRRCASCAKRKPLTQFSPTSGGRRSYYCKPCNSARVVASYRKRHPEGRPRKPHAKRFHRRVGENQTINAWPDGHRTLECLECGDGFTSVSKLNRRCDSCRYLEGVS